MVSQVTPEELHDALAAEGPYAVVDLRPSLPYVEGHIPGSIHVERATLEQRLPVVVPHMAVTTVLVDGEGERAPADARWLQQLGYTDVRVLAGGYAAYEAAGLPVVAAVDGVHATAFNTASKRFGEEVEHRFDPPRLSPDAVAERAEELTIIDVRNPPEYDAYGTLPGSINIEGVDVALYAEAARRDDEPLVLHCAGRTRSIMATATLQALGVEEVYELENGTMGWQLAGHQLATGQERPTGLTVAPGHRAQLRARVEELLAETAVEWIDAAELDATIAERATDTAVYCIDVRPEAAAAAGTHPAARSIAGGQLLQTTESEIGVRAGQIILLSDSHIRAGITAYWLAEMGYPAVAVVRGGLAAWTDAGGEPTPPQPPAPLAVDTSAVEVVAPRAVEASAAETVLDCRSRAAYAAGHIPGAVWVGRYHLEESLQDRDSAVVLVDAGDGVAAMAVAQVASVGPDRAPELRVVEGGMPAWVAAGNTPTADAATYAWPDETAVPKPYAQGTAAMRAYLAWEEALVDE
jgi:rhodanese-related sulfurtransferase